MVARDGREWDLAVPGRFFGERHLSRPPPGKREVEGEPRYRPSGRSELWLTREAAERRRRLAGVGSQAYELCGEAPFSLMLDGHRLHSGQCYLRGGAAWIEQPVMHIEEAAGRIVLRIGDRQGRWLMIGPDADEHARRLVDPAALRELFARSGKLQADRR